MPIFPAVLDVLVGICALLCRRLIKFQIKALETPPYARQDTLKADTKRITLHFALTKCSLAVINSNLLAFMPYNFH